jgi:hypothetical protein
MKQSRRWPWLVAVVLLLVAAGWLMSRGDPPEKTPAVEKVQFPTRLRGPEYERMERRRTLETVLQAAFADAGRPAQAARRRDPMLAALPAADKNKTAVVFEANALRNSPVGELLLDCLRTRSGGENPFDSVRKQTGIDPLVDIDRVAMTTDGVLISGDFSHANWDQVFSGKATRTSYGDHGTIFTPPSSTDASGNKRPVGAVGSWNNELMVTGQTVEQVQAMLDRLEGRAAPQPSIIDESDSFGEVYGVLAPDDVVHLLGPDQKELAQKVLDVAQQVKLHVDAQSDVAVVADLSGPDGDKVTDLGKSLGGVLSLARLKAQADNDTDFADLLDLARVTPDNGKFRAELALPMDFLSQKLAWCREKLDGGVAPAPAPQAPEPAAPAPGAPSENGGGSTP